MKRIFLLSLTILTTFLLLSAQKQDLLIGKFSREELKNVLVPVAKWVPFAKPGDRTGWSTANQDMLKAYTKTAESLMGYGWPYIPATKSLLIERTGDRKNTSA